MQLRWYQQEYVEKIEAKWAAKVDNVLGVLPTGAGKTVVMGHFVKKNIGPCCAIAHRQELVSQISIAMAREGIRHRIIGPKDVVKLCISLHMEELKKSYYQPGAPAGVVGVDTLISRVDKLRPWLDSLTLWLMDEAHHVLQSNKWGRAVELFPNARGLGVTATPLRADGKGLGADTDGVFGAMVAGVRMRQLIEDGFLAPYRIVCPDSDVDLRDVTVSAGTGDYDKRKLKVAVRRSHIIGDVVLSYIKFALGVPGVTFASDVETANDISDQFNAHGIPAAAVSAKTPNAERVAIVRRFRNRQLMQLVNVDLFGEGFDLPDLGVVSMARPTQSYGLYAQQFGRALRPMEGKIALIIDHVGNVVRHKLPDGARQWSLARRGRSDRSEGGIPVKVCPECTAAYEAFHAACPFCGHRPEPLARSNPEFVDGDLIELDEATLARMRGEVSKVDATAAEYRRYLETRKVPNFGIGPPMRRHAARQAAQRVLRESIAWWAGHQSAKGRSNSEGYRRFYHTFGVDVLTAKALGTADAVALTEKVNRLMEV